MGFLQRRNCTSNHRSLSIARPERALLVLRPGDGAAEIAGASLSRKEDADVLL
jgi:uncharacterized protein (DUF2237 family)